MALVHVLYGTYILFRYEILHHVTSVNLTSIYYIFEKISQNE